MYSEHKIVLSSKLPDLAACSANIPSKAMRRDPDKLIELDSYGPRILGALSTSLLIRHYLIISDV